MRIVFFFIVVCRMTWDGYDYDGDDNTTADGNLCVPWSDSRISSLNISYVEDQKDMTHNFCRNPTRTGSEPWCFVESDNDTIIQEDCSIPKCGEF